MKRKPTPSPRQAEASRTSPSARPPASRPEGTAASPSSGTTEPARDLVMAAGEFDRLRLFASALRVAGLESLLAERGPFTIFAPTNRAFEKLSRQTYESLLADPERLATVLCHHVVPGRVKAPKPGAPRLAMPIAGTELRLSASDDRYHVEDANIVRTNIKATNGVIHAIDTVLLPA